MYLSAIGKFRVVWRLSSDNATRSNETHHEVLLVREHDIGCVGIISTIRLVDLEFFLLLFRNGHARQGQRDKENKEWRRQWTF
jgi:hypothetical protein